MDSGWIAEVKELSTDGGVRRLRRTQDRGGQLGAHRDFYITRPASIVTFDASDGCRFWRYTISGNWMTDYRDWCRNRCFEGYDEHAHQIDKSGDRSGEISSTEKTFSKQVDSGQAYRQAEAFSGHQGYSARAR